MRGFPALFAIGGLILAAALTGADVHARFGDLAFIALVLVWGGLAALATRVGEDCPARTGLWLVIVVAILLRIPLLLEEPKLSDDIFRYVWDGRVQAAGINPYCCVPASEALASLRDAAIFPFISRADYAITLYPPGAQAFFLFVTRAGESVLVMKAGLVACEALIVALVIDLLRLTGRASTRVVAYAWHPLPAWEIAGNGHVEAVMVAALMLAVWLSIRWRRGLAGVALGFAVMVKPYAALAFPALWRPGDWRLPALATLTAAAVALPYLSAGTGMFAFLPGYIGEERIDSGGGFWLLGAVERLTGTIPGGSGIYIAVALSALMLLGLRALLGSGGTPIDRLRDLNLLLLAFCFFLSTDYPWYFLMFVPLLSLVASPSAWVLSVGGFLLYDVVAGDAHIDFLYREWALNLGFLAAAGWAGRHRLRKSDRTKPLEIPS